MKTAPRQPVPRKAFAEMPVNVVVRDFPETLRILARAPGFSPKWGALRIADLDADVEALLDGIESATSLRGPPAAQEVPPLAQ
ncbi:MAG: hypothetical protein BMS9Abin29_0642 [Gemmatimonadota bacterium]|nr:MAG: hypothetical protein BMS9Abin29_0642 [Gemmatimonadota bacterium]